MTGGISYPWDSPPEFGVPVQVAEGIEWVRIPLPMKLDHVNCYLLDGPDGVTLIDTGLNTRKTRDIWSNVLGDRQVQKVLITHHHPDHVGLAGWFQTEFGAELLSSRTSWLMTRMLQLDEQPLPVPETLAFWRAAGMDAEIYAERLTERPLNYCDAVWPLPLGYRRVVDGSVLELGSRRWRVRFGAGHAPDHITLWEEGGDLVIGGDQILASISPNLGVYPTEPEADPVGDWIMACEKLLLPAEDRHLVLPGHKLPFTGLPFRLRQLIDNHHSALERLHGALAEPLTAGQCFGVLYGRRIGKGEYGLALVEALGHCLHLMHEGRATREITEDGLWLFRAA
ncbi:MBL fold metallo-hydrolase [Palleronia caenipelagi]|uniref:MBL fold metallo-hydrolase n=1 Tax=Palleronia caenipelagi TaxID=2489174 RepID=A0A547Q2V7_9RHOB|nr:MBL fold metallo-hydrolase [Palleronia caenipelagi]TRD20727.1 MBL fold metallo-hydrolase [Palleronia caenipelagi]